MPFFPYTDRNPSSGQYAGQTPVGNLLDRAASAVCSAYVPITRWADSAWRSVGVPGGAAGILSGSNVVNNLCTPYGVPPAVPLTPALPPFPTNCATFGVITFQQNNAAPGAPPVWAAGDVQWDCNADIGIPTGRWRWRQAAPAAIWGYERTFTRPSGGTRLVAVGSVFYDDPTLVQIQGADIQYCPSCGLPPPPPPPPPEIPEDGEEPDPADPPIIIIDIDFPTPPGLPPISFPVTYSPVINFNTPINLQPIVTLAPRLDLNPAFNFAPTFEFNLGGITIGGGGYPEPREDVADIVDCDCPDPCPPGGEVDYPRIAQIVETRLASVRTGPGAVLPFNITAPVTGTEISISLPPGTRGVLYSLDLTDYSGGASFGADVANSVFYAAAGWFGFDEDLPGGERVFLNFINGYLDAPSFAARFTVKTRLGAIATVRAVVSDDFPDP